MRRSRHAKILVTLGPASSSPEVIEALFRAGADVFRFNFSHGSHADHLARLEILRGIERETGRPVGILADIQGPKLRVGGFEGDGAELNAGAPFRLDLDDAPGNSARVQLPHPEIFESLSDGAHLLLDDGKIRLKVERFGPDFAETTVITGGRLSNNKGVNVPNVVLPISAMTEKDHRDVAFALDKGFDWIAMSFVQRAEDLAAMRKVVGRRAGLLAKLEKPSGIAALDGVLEIADAVMVARGDLGVEVPPEDVPLLQKHIVREARRAGKPVVVATQMMESMINAPSPTRAEASDVATAVFEGADAVMLSAETAVGAYPVEATTIMNRIIERVEQDAYYRDTIESSRNEPEGTAADAISSAARQVAHTLSAAAIVTYSTSGATTLRAARERPEVPILGLTSDITVARRLTIAWGVHSINTKDVKTFAEMVKKACRVALRDGFAARGQRVVITAGVPFGTPGATNILRVAWVDEGNSSGND